MEGVVIALVSVVIGAGLSYLITLQQRRWAQEDKERDRQTMRRSLRALLRDEIAQNQEFLRDYQDDLEKTEFDTPEQTMPEVPERYNYVMANPIHVWHAMWQGQAQYLGVILASDEIVATARYHSDLDALVTNWNHLFAIKQSMNDELARIDTEHSDPALRRQVSAPIKALNVLEMRKPYESVAQGLQLLINSPNPIGLVD